MVGPFDKSGPDFAPSGGTRFIGHLHAVVLQPIDRLVEIVHSESDMVGCVASGGFEIHSVLPEIRPRDPATPSWRTSSDRRPRLGLYSTCGCGRSELHPIISLHVLSTAANMPDHGGDIGFRWRGDLGKKQPLFLRPYGVRHSELGLFRIEFGRIKLDGRRGIGHVEMHVVKMGKLPPRRFLSHANRGDQASEYKSLADESHFHPLYPPPGRTPRVKLAIADRSCVLLFWRRARWHRPPC